MDTAHKQRSELAGESPRKPLQPNQFEADAVPRFSPDGMKIAFFSDRTGDGVVWIMNADGSNQTQLGDSPQVGPIPVRLREMTSM